MKKILTFIGVLGSIVAGALLLNSVVPASAGTLTPQATDQTASSCAPRASLKDVLDKLVADGTITQDQEDKIHAALKAAHESNKANNQANGQSFKPRVKALRAAAQVAADKIGVSIDELKTAVKGGQSVAQVADAHGVAPADVEKAIVDAATTKIDQAVSAGTLTEQQGGFLKARLPEMANKFVNHTGGASANACGQTGGSQSSGGSDASNSSSTDNPGSSTASG